MLVDWFGDPLGVRVSSDSFMEWINEDNLKESVCRIFTNPVGIRTLRAPQWRPVHSSATDCRLRANELFDTMVDRLAVGGTLSNGAFAAPSAHTDLVYDIALYER